MDNSLQLLAYFPDIACFWKVLEKGHTFSLSKRRLEMRKVIDVKIINKEVGGGGRG